MYTYYTVKYVIKFCILFNAIVLQNAKSYMGERLVFFVLFLTGFLLFWFQNYINIFYIIKSY